MMAPPRPETPSTMQQRIGWILSTALIVGCTAQSPSAPDATTPPAASTAANAAPTIGVDLAGIDKSVKPGDDFDAYANGAWRKATAIPDDRAAIGTGFYVFQKAEKRNQELIQDIAKANPAAGTDQRRIADYYTAYMDEAGIEKRGLAAIDADLKAIDGIADTKQLSRALGAQVVADVDPLNATNYDTEHLFGVFVSQGLTQPDTTMAYVMQGGLGMPNREYYLAADKDMQDNRAKYEAYVAKLLELSGTQDAAKKAKDIVALETKIARAHANVVDTSDVHKANNPWPMADWSKKAPGIDWPTFFEAASLSGQPIVYAWQPQAIT